MSRTYAALLIAFTLPLLAAPSSINLSVLPNPPVFASTTTLTANVSPSSTTGSITFYDGATFLARVALTSGSATFTTKLLPAGLRQLRAFYTGDAANGASTSSVIKVQVTPLPVNGVKGPTSFPASSNPGTYFGAGALAGDFNGDGAQDVVTIAPGGLLLLLGSPTGLTQTPISIPVSVGDPWGVMRGDFMAMG